MTTAVNPSVQKASDKLIEELAEVEEKVVLNYTLADAMREGSRVSEQCPDGWSDDKDRICALSTAEAGLLARTQYQG